MVGSAQPNPYLLVIIPSVISLVVGAVLAYLQKKSEARAAKLTKESEERSAAKLEILRLALGKELHSFTARSSVLAQKHVDLLSEIYFRLWEIKQAIPGELKDTPDTKWGYGAEVWERIDQAIKLLARNRIFLNRKLAEDVRHVLDLLMDQVGEYTAAKSLPDTEEAFMASMKEIFPIRKQIDTLLTRLEEDFRKLLHGEY